MFKNSHTYATGPKLTGTLCSLSVIHAWFACGMLTHMPTVSIPQSAYSGSAEIPPRLSHRMCTRSILNGNSISRNGEGRDPHSNVVRNRHVIIVPLDMKGYICHFRKWQIHPFISKQTVCQVSDNQDTRRPSLNRTRQVVLKQYKREGINISRLLISYLVSI